MKCEFCKDITCSFNKYDKYNKNDSVAAIMTDDKGNSVTVVFRSLSSGPVDSDSCDPVRYYLDADVYAGDLRGNSPLQKLRSKLGKGQVAIPNRPDEGNSRTIYRSDYDTSMNQRFENSEELKGDSKVDKIINRAVHYYKESKYYQSYLQEQAKKQAKEQAKEAARQINRQMNRKKFDNFEI